MFLQCTQQTHLHCAPTSKRHFALHSGHLDLQLATPYFPKTHRALVFKESLNVLGVCGFRNTMFAMKPEFVMNQSSQIAFCHSSNFIGDNPCVKNTICAKFCCWLWPLRMSKLTWGTNLIKSLFGSNGRTVPLIKKPNC